MEDYPFPDKCWHHKIVDGLRTPAWLRLDSLNFRRKNIFVFLCEICHVVKYKHIIIEEDANGPVLRVKNKYALVDKWKGGKANEITPWTWNSKSTDKPLEKIPSEPIDTKTTEGFSEGNTGKS